MEWILNGLDGPLFTILADTSLKGSLIAAILIGVTSVLGRQRARLRGLLYNVGILMLLGLPVMTLVASLWDAPVANGSPFTSFSPQPPFTAIPIPVEVDQTATPLQVVFALYGVGLALALLRVFTSLLGLVRLNRDLSPIVDPKVESRLTSVKAQLGLTRSVRLAKSALVDSPCQTGITRPTIVLPATHDFEPSELDTVFLHEVVHIKRHDCLFKLLGSLCLALYWFNPLIWRVVRQNAQTQDEICDDWVVYLQKSPDRYVETLVSVVRSFKSPDSFAYQLDMAKGSGLLERIRRIQELDGIRPTLGSSGFTFALVTSAGLILLAASLQVIVSPAVATSPGVVQPVTAAKVVSPVLATEPPAQPAALLSVIHRPSVPYEFTSQTVDQPEGWLTREVLAMAAPVDPLEVSQVVPKQAVTNHDIMPYPKPSAYADLLAENRLIAPAGATYHKELTMGRVSGTQFNSRPFYTGPSSDEPAIQPEEAQSPVGIVDPRKNRQKNSN